MYFHRPEMNTPEECVWNNGVHVNVLVKVSFCYLMGGFLSLLSVQVEFAPLQCCERDGAL